MNIVISPSQLAFAYDGCPRCLWLGFRKVTPARGDYEQFNLLDRIQAAAFPAGAPLHHLGIPGKVKIRAPWVKSRDYGKGTSHCVQVIGKPDIVADLDGGGVGIVDNKTAMAKPELVAKYRRQLSGYALSMMEPEQFEPADVRSGHLLAWWGETGTYVPESDPPAIMVPYYGTALPVDFDLDEVRACIDRIAATATLLHIPDALDGCKACDKYREYAAAVRKAKEAGQAVTAALQERPPVATTAPGPLGDAQRELAKCAPGTAAYDEALAAVNALLKGERRAA